MRILLTGLSGFTGSYLRAELEKHGHDVIGLASNLLNSDGLSTEIAQIKPEAVIHLAAVAFVASANNDDFYQVNLLGTLNLLEALSKHTSNLHSILLTSSATIYGNSQKELLDEGTGFFPANDYAVSKLAMEYMAQLWVDRLPLFIVRPFNYTGVGQTQKFLIPKIVNHFINKLPTLELGNLDVWREFGDVRVVAEIYRKLLELNPIGKIINVCTSQAYSLREVLALAETMTEHYPEIIINPDFVRKNEVRKLIGDNSLLKSLIGNWTALSFSETLWWMLKQNESNDSLTAL